MNKIDIEEYKFLLMEELVIEYGMSELEAQRVIAKSAVNKMLKRSPDFVMHYSIEDNASEIYNEFVGMPFEM